MVEPQIIVSGSEGLHNSKSQSKRLTNAKSYKDLSTVCVIPSRGMVPIRAAESWMGLANPMNQKFVRMVITGMEVGAAYTAAVETILDNEELRKWKYVLTLEEDNLPPPDGLLKLYESMDRFDVVGGIYWTKGEEGQPMIYGDPTKALNFVPQKPRPETVQECHGLGMGFTLFKLDLFRDKKLDKPYFQTVQTFDPYEGGKAYTQDLHFFERIKKLGYKVACDTRVKVGHIDDQGRIW